MARHLKLSTQLERLTIIRLVCYKGSPTTMSGVSHFSLPFICPLLWQSRVQCSLYFPSAQSGSVLHCPKAECDMQKRAKRAKCGHFSGQFSRCCLWGQKRPRPVCRVMEAADAFPSNCRSLCSRVNDGIIGVNVGLSVCVCVAAAA